MNLVAMDQSETALKLEDVNLISNFVSSVVPFVPQDRQESKTTMNAEAFSKLWHDSQL